MGYPTAAQVLAPTAFGASNEVTGTRTDAPVASVKKGVTYGAGGTALTGTYNPAAINSRVTLREDLDLGQDLTFGGKTGGVKVLDADGATVAFSRIIQGRWQEPVNVPTGQTYKLIFTNNSNHRQTVVSQAL